MNHHQDPPPMTPEEERAELERTIYPSPNLRVAIGDPLCIPKLQVKDKHITRLYHQNPNGLNVQVNGSFDCAVEHLKDMEVDHGMFSDHQQDTSQHRVLKKMKQACEKHLGHHGYVLNATSTTAQARNAYKPGGVLSITMDHLLPRIIESGHDKYGRWVYTKFQRQRGLVWTVICTYQVCEGNPKTAGDSTYAMQLLSMFQAENRTDPHLLRRHHRDDLTKFVKECTDKGEAICMGGDFNEEIGLEATGMTTLCRDFDMIDIVLEQHGRTDFATWSRGMKILDYMLISKSLLPAVTASGYEPFFIRILGDHRGVYIDFDSKILLGDDHIPAAKWEQRDVVSTRVHQIAPYIGKNHGHLTEHKYFDGLRKLQECMATDVPNHDLAEVLYTRQERACLYAAHRLPRYHKGACSAEIARMRNIKTLLHLYIHQQQYYFDHSERINDLEDRLQSINFVMPTSIAQAQILQRANQKNLTEASKEVNQKKLRRQQQDTLAAKYDKAGDKTEAKRVRQMQRAEDSARVYRKCSVARGLNKSGGIRDIQVPTNPDDDPKTCNDWTTLSGTDRDDAINAKNQAHFGIARDRPLCQEPLDVTMNFTGACEDADAILDGIYDTSDARFSAASTLLLDNMQYLTTPDVIEPYITVAQLEAKIKAWPEKTSTSPLSKVHLGHPKALLARHALPPDSEEAATLQNQQSEILNALVTLTNYAIHFGYSYKRWREIANGILNKDPGLPPRIHRIRVIHLYEWLWNGLMGIKWREVSQHVRKLKLANKSLYAMPGKEALDAVFIKELEYEICRLTMKILAQFDNDMAGCFDNILCFLANVCSRKFGMNKKLCIVQGKTMEEAKYYLKTELGISEKFIQHTREDPWFGTGQGSSNSPPYWTFICSTLFDIFESQAEGATYTSPDRSITIQMFAVGFVDDVNTRTNDFEPTQQPTLASIIAKTTTDSQLWHDTLASSNQQLEPSKCSTHVIHYEFDDDGNGTMVETVPDPTDPTTGPTMHINDSAGNPIPIKQKSVTEAAKYLGCQKAPANQKAQQESLEKKCKDFARVVNCSSLTRRDAKCFYYAIYNPSIGYPLPMTYFTHDELHKIQMPSHHAMTCKMGYNRYTAKEILFGPTNLGGAGLFHLYDLQGIGQLSYFMKSWRTPHTEQGTLLRIVVYWAQYCAGTSRSIFDDTTIKLPHLATKWITSLRDYLETISGKLTLQDPGIIPLERQQDTHLMDLILNHPKLSEPAKIRINNYRLYLGIGTSSDLCNARGTHIDKHIYNGEQPPDSPCDNWLQTNQTKPGIKALKEWQKALRLLADGKTLKLHQNLGNWIVPRTDMRRNWKFLYNPTDDTLYHHTETGWTQHRKLTIDFDNQPTNWTGEPPAHAIPADVITHQHVFQLLQPNYHGYTLKPTWTASPTLAATIPTLDEWERELLAHVELIGVTEQELVHILTTEAVLVASDGSAPNPKASFAWIICRKNGTRIAQCNGPAYGYKPTSYRAEGYGILSVLRFLIRLRECHNCPEFKAYTHLCDNKSMVVKAPASEWSSSPTPNSTKASEWDLIAEIWTSNETFSKPARPIYDHIKSHQDDTTPYEELSLAAQLNVDADRLANDYITQNPDKYYNRVPLLPTSGIQLDLPCGTITYKVNREIKYARSAPILKAKYCKLYKWNLATLETIDWEAHRLASNRHHKQRVTLTKHINNIVPVGVIVNHYHPKYPRSCPSCQAHWETCDHLYTCPDPERAKWRTTFLQELRKKMEALNTHPGLQDLLLTSMEKIITEDDPSGSQVPQELQLLMDSQTSIGWPQLIRGRFSIHWQQIQQRHLGQQSTKKKKTSISILGLLTTPAIGARRPS